MLTQAEILRSSYGAWRLLLGDASGLTHIDTTSAGMWRSFLLAPLLLPFFLLMVIQHAIEVGAGRSWPHIFGIELSAYAIGWSAFPLAMVWIAPLIDREREYDGYIAAYNWSNVVQFALVMPLVLVGLVSILPDGILEVLSIAVNLGLLAYGWFIARTALRLPALGAIAIVALDFIIAIFVRTIADLMIA
jgi:hypothetical protein